MTADKKYSVHNRENLPKQIQMQESKKPKTKILNSLLHILNLYKIFEDFGKKDEPHSWCISEIIDSEKRDYLNVSKAHFRKPFNSQHVKGSQTPLKSAQQPFHFMFDHCGRNWVGKHLC